MIESIENIIIQKVLPEHPTCCVLVLGNDIQSDFGQKVPCNQEAVAILSTRDGNSLCYVCAEHLRFFNLGPVVRPKDPLMEVIKAACK